MYAIKTGTKTVTTSFTYECFEIGQYLAFKATAQSSNSRKSVERQGIAAKSAVRTLATGKFPEGERGSRFMLLTDEQIEGVQKRGYAFFVDHRNEKINKAPRPEIYDYLVAGGDIKNVLRLDGWNQFYDLNDEIVPTGMAFDYIQSHVENSRYDLAKVVDILRQRDDVFFAEGEDREYWQIDKERPEIKSIPYYNRESGRSAYVPFIWLPSPEIMKVLEADMSNRYKIVFEQDLLGLRAGGAAKFEDFYAAPPYSYDEDDEG